MLSQSTIPFQGFKQQSSTAGSKYIKFLLASVEPEAFGCLELEILTHDSSLCSSTIGQCQSC